MLLPNYLELLAGGATAVVMMVGAVTVVSGIRDRHSRRLALLPSPEEQKIDRMHAEGLITAAEAETLRRDCRALPEIEEISPVPDLPLRLAAALSRACALMFPAALLMAAAITLWLHWWPENGRRSLTADCGTELIGLIILRLGLAAATFAAARKVLTGSLRARNILVGCWLTALFFPDRFGDGGLSQFWTAAWFGCGIYTIFVLLFRRRAAAAIRSRAGEASPAWKAAVALLIATAAVLSLFLSSENGYSFDFLRQSATSFTHAAAEPGGRIEKLFLLTPGDDPIAAKLLAPTATALETGLGVRCLAVTTADGLQVDWSRQAVILLESGITAPPDSPPPLPAGLPPEVRRVIAADRRALTGSGFAIPVKRPAVRFRLLAPTNTVLMMRQGFRVVDQPIQFDGTATLHGETPRKIRKTAQVIADLITPALRRNCSEEVPRQVVLPVEKGNEPPAIDLSGVKNPRLLATGGGNALASFRIYQFERQNPDGDLAAVRRALAAFGFDSERETGDGGRIFFRHGNSEHQAVLDSGSSTARYPAELTGIRLETRHAILAVATFRTGKSPVPDMQMLEKLRRDDLRGFAAWGGLALLPPAELPGALKCYLAGKPPLAEQLRAITAISGLHPSPETRSVLSEAFDAIGETIAANPCRKTFFAEADALLRLLRQPEFERERQAFISRLGSRHYIELTLPDIPVENGKRTWHFETPFEFISDKGFQLLVELRFENRDLPPRLLQFGYLVDGGILQIGTLATSSNPAKDWLKSCSFSQLCKPQANTWLERSITVPQTQTEAVPAPGEWQFRGHAAIRDGRCRIIGKISEIVDCDQRPSPSSGSSIPRQ